MSDAKASWITSRLIVGSPPTNVSGLFAFVDEPSEALRVMRLGATAILPADRFDLAEQTLVLAGRDAQTIAFALAVARGEAKWDGCL